MDDQRMSQKLAHNGKANPKSAARTLEFINCFHW